MTEVLLLVVIALAVALFRLSRRVAALEARLTGDARPVVAPPVPRVPDPPPVPRPAPPPSVPSLTPPTPPVRPLPDLPPRHRPTPVDIETLVGTRLPIWIGGVALVVAGVFLVRLSIEAGWLTPAVRTLLAAAFAATLLGMSEGARRLSATRDDPRVGQVLAGAGIASAYATLYLAAALYHLMDPLAGFLVMLAITALGLFLALRHGPPTAVMALVGGFVAPLIAGYDAAGIGALLGYLGLFVAALLALAMVRGWAWLALGALAAAFGWAGLLIALVPSGELVGVGGFLVALGVAGTIAAPRAAVAAPLLRVAPLVVALVQLLVLAPTLDFGWLAWGFYLTLSAAALFLGYRDAVLLRGGLVAAVLVTLLVALGLLNDGMATDGAWPIAMLLFGAVGGGCSRRAPAWAAIALTGVAGPLLAVQLVDPARWPPVGWSALDLLVALAAGALAWRHRDRAGAGDIGLVGGVAVAAMAVGLAVAAVVPVQAVTLAPLAALGVLAIALRLDPAAIGRLMLVPVAVATALALPFLAQFGVVLVKSMLFEALPYPLLPTPGEAPWRLLLPAGAILAAARLLPDAFGTARRGIELLAALVVVIGVYLLLKQGLAIATLPRFRQWGFVERAVLSDFALLAGWGLWTRAPLAGRALVALGLARIGWFDLLGLNPLWIEQAVGPWPVLNAATLHLSLAAAVVWRLAGLPRRRWIAATLTLLALLATIRQVAHGSILTGPVGTPENWGYSAAMLALAILWLWRGVARGVADLRRFGLTLLTFTTLKVFLVDAAALAGVLRILSFLGLGLALIAIGWGYRRFVTAGDSAPPAGRAPA